MKQSQNCQLNPQSGFTLIEIMMAIAIVGILATIATVSYQVQIRQAHLISIYQDLNHLRLPYQILVEEETKTTDFSANGLNMPSSTKYCQFTVTAPLAGSTTANTIICRIQNLPYLQAQTLSLDYLADGGWQCQASAGIKDAYLPQACQ